ncbi:porin [Thermogutta sp.]|uniref:porin n=1 Tax=Thermogutta sp. TaxID=1962930 RepID=UPI003C7CE5B4
MESWRGFWMAAAMGALLAPVIFARELPEWPPRWPDEQGPVLSDPNVSAPASELQPVVSLSEPDKIPQRDFAQLVSGLEEAAAAPLAPVPESTPAEESAPVARPCPASCPDRWTIPQPWFLQRLGIRMGGWLEQGITFNAQEPPDQFNGPVATNDLDHEYQMNQLWLYFDRPADNGGCGWAWGGHVDMTYGTDWRFGINNGLEDRINGLQTYGLVLPQFYLELAYNRLSVKMGHFAAILDYEAVPAPMNPFYSHSYSYGYTVPQLVTGMLFDYRWTPLLSFQAGFHRGWMQFEDNNDRLDFMGGVKWHSEDNRLSIAYAVSAGPQDDAANQDRFVYSLVVQWQMTDRFKYVLVHNLGTENRAAPGGQDAEWYGLNQYFLYTINPCWSAGMRVEWLRDDDGVRIAGPGNIPGIRAWSGRGFAGDFYEITWGLNWRPNGNWLVRPEIRWDWYDGPAGPTGLPFDGGSSDSQLTFAMDAIFSF